MPINAFQHLNQIQPCLHKLYDDVENNNSLVNFSRDFPWSQNPCGVLVCRARVVGVTCGRVRRDPRARGRHLRAAAGVLARQRAAGTRRARRHGGGAGAAAGPAPRGLAVHRPAAARARRRHRGVPARRGHALPVRAGVHHGGPLPEPAPQRVPPRLLRVLRL